MIFSDMGNTIKIKYTQNNKQFEVKLFDHCDLSRRREGVPIKVINFKEDKEQDKDGCSEITVTLNIDVGMLDNSVVFRPNMGNPNIGTLSLCVELSLLADVDLFAGGIAPPGMGDYTDVTFNQMVLEANFDFEEGFANFTIDSDINLDRDEVEGIADNADIDYSVSACECNKDSICFNEFPELVKPLITQSSKLYLCLNVTADDVHIKSVKDLNLTKNFLTLPAIQSEKWNPLTSVNITGDQSVIITTQLVSLFYVDIHSPVGAKGNIILDYATLNPESRRRRRRELTVSFDTNSRKLNLNEVEAPFNLSGVRLGLDVSASGMNLFWMRGLSLCGFILSLVVNFS